MSGRKVTSIIITLFACVSYIHSSRNARLQVWDDLLKLRSLHWRGNKIISWPLGLSVLHFYNTEVAYMYTDTVRVLTMWNHLRQSYLYCVASGIRGGGGDPPRATRFCPFLGFGSGVARMCRWDNLSWRLTLVAKALATSLCLWDITCFSVGAGTIDCEGQQPQGPPGKSKL